MNHLGWRVGTSHTSLSPREAGWMSFPAVLKVEMNPHSLMGSYPGLPLIPHWLHSPAKSKRRKLHKFKSVCDQFCHFNSHFSPVPLVVLGLCHSSDSPQNETQTFSVPMDCLEAVCGVESWAVAQFQALIPLILAALAGSSSVEELVSFSALFLGIDLTSDSKTPTSFYLHCWCSKK